MLVTSSKVETEESRIISPASALPELT